MVIFRYKLVCDDEVICNLLGMNANFQTSTSAHPILVKMAAHVLILLEVTAVIVCRDILATTVKQVIVP